MYISSIAYYMSHFITVVIALFQNNQMYNYVLYQNFISNYLAD